MQNLVAPIFQKGSDGDTVLSSSAAINGAYSAVTGTQYAVSLAVTTPASFAAGDLVLIHQTQGTGALNMEWNVIQSINGGSSPFTMAIPLQNTYNAGAQMIKFPRYKSFVQNSSVNINVSTWDGAKNGIGGLFCEGNATFNGSVNMNGLGFRLGAGGGVNTVGSRGEGTTGNDQAQSQTPQQNGGGGGGYSNNGPWDQGNGGAGGANSATNAQSGNGTGGGNNSNGPAGSPGLAVGTPNLDQFSLGGGGGGGGNTNGSGNGKNGGNGAGAFVVVAKRIILGATASFTANGNSGVVANFHAGCGGSGGGGSFLLICEELVWTSGAVLTASGGPHIVNNNGGPDSDGGAGGDGRIAVQCGKITNASGSFASTPVYNNNGFSKFCARVGASGF